MSTGYRRAGGRQCPHCGGRRILPIVYGLPSTELEADARAGRVVLGGCAPDGTEPTRHCSECGYEWRPDGGDAGGGWGDLTSRAPALPRQSAPDSDGDEAEALALEVDAGALHRALDLFSRWLPAEQQGADASLWLEGTQLVVRVGNDEARVPARGLWPGIVVVPVGRLLACLDEIRERARIVLSIEGDRLRLVPTFKIPFRLRSPRLPWPEFIEFERSPRLLERLLLPQAHSTESIDYSGLTGSVKSAEDALVELVEGARDAVSETSRHVGVDADEAFEAIRGLVYRGLGRQPREEP